MPDPKKNHQTSGFKTFIIPSNINPISIRILSESPWNLFRSGPSNGCSPGILLTWDDGVATPGVPFFLFVHEKAEQLHDGEGQWIPFLFFVYHYYHLVL